MCFTVSHPFHRPFEEGIDLFQLLEAAFPESTKILHGSSIYFRGLHRAQTLYEVKTPGEAPVITEQVFT